MPMFLYIRMDTCLKSFSFVLTWYNNIFGIQKALWVTESKITLFLEN